MAVKKIKEKTVAFLGTLKGKMAAAAAAAFAFVIALSWNDTIKTSVDSIIVAMGLQGSPYTMKVITSVIVTIIALIGIYFASKFEIDQGKK